MQTIIHPLPGNILVFTADGDPTPAQCEEFRVIAAKYKVTVIVMAPDSTIELLDDDIMKEHGWIRAQ